MGRARAVAEAAEVLLAEPRPVGLQAERLPEQDLWEERRLFPAPQELELGLRQAPRDCHRGALCVLTRGPFCDPESRGLPRELAQALQA